MDSMDCGGCGGGGAALHSILCLSLTLDTSTETNTVNSGRQSLNEITAVLGSHASLCGAGTFLETYRSPLLELLLEVQDVDAHPHLAAHAEGMRCEPYNSNLRS
jgi:hypothetical protein